MTDEESLLRDLKPDSKPKVIDLVAGASFDVSDWSNFKGGAESAGTNPKYCYEWCFEQGEVVLLNIWYENLKVEKDVIFQRLNMRRHPSNQSGVRKARAKRFDRAVKNAFEGGSNVRVIILDRKVPGVGGATGRLLDDVSWTVVKYDDSNGDFEIRRGITTASHDTVRDPQLEEFREGEARRLFVVHRHRERALRQKKIEDHKRKNGDRLICEVPGCGFDFATRYGTLGEDYAQVHHLVPLSKVETQGTNMTLNDLAIVCANCHVMIHRGGECREISSLIAGRN